MDAFALWGNEFATIIGGATHLLLPYATALAYCSMALAGMWLAATIGLSNAGVSMGAVRLLIAAGAWITATDYAQPIGEGLLEGAVQFGLLAGGHTLTHQQFIDSPDSIFALGFDKTITLWDMANQTCAPWYEGECLAHLSAYLPLSLAGWAVFFAFTYLAGSVMMTCIIFKILILISVILLPLAIFEHTSWLATGTVRAIVHSVVQVLTLAIVASVGSAVIAKISIHHGETPAMLLPVSDSLPIIIGSLVLIALTMASQVIAWRVVSGGILSAGAVFGSAAGLGAAGARSAAGHLDGPVTTAAKAGVGSAYRSISAAASANASGIERMTRPTVKQ